MDFSIPQPLQEDVDRTTARVAERVVPHLHGMVPRRAKCRAISLRSSGQAGWYGFEFVPRGG